MLDSGYDAREDLGMREPSKSDSLIAPSIEEIHGRLVHEVTPRIGRKAKFRGRKLYPGPLLNAIVLHFMSLPHGQQQEIAERTPVFARLTEKKILLSVIHHVRECLVDKSPEYRRIGSAGRGTADVIGGP